MRQLRPYKFLVVPVLQLVDDDGDVVGEQQPQQPDVVFGVDGLERYAAGFPAALEQHNAALVANAVANGAGPAVPAV